ncbi:succinate dehydrogenase, hydrophobic membrane anchor protein [Chachezhania antarctica]|uniref:succinate dehydrogenase, hydrophobic membrane anchor protein n=1 Tax=Chachezhania antarctica TaxID=2340860 RepID=UPI000EAD15CC|nr:succinate dehydrogenase, hydrophobic membrane anchor protein [Chachezhania antarctica]|tara:strand:+ start:1229 stop:1600 length:372 start_codon:yes stop_codon:yes gene_type:complete
MGYLTDRKRAVGWGSAKSGTEHAWAMKVSSAALLILIPLFLITVAPMTGQPYDVVVAHFAKPFPAIVAALTFVVGFMHFKDGVRVLIEDYVHGAAQQWLIIGMTCLCYAAAAVGILAVARLAI